MECYNYDPKLTDTEKMIIETLSLNGVPMTPYQIKEKIERSYAGVANMCKQLENKGFLTSNRIETKRKSVKIEYWFTNAGSYLAFKIIYEKSLSRHINDGNGVFLTTFYSDEKQLKAYDTEESYRYTLSDCDLILKVLRIFSNSNNLFQILYCLLEVFLDLMPNQKDRERYLIGLLEPFIWTINMFLETSIDLTNGPLVTAHPGYIFREISNSNRYTSNIVLSDGSKIDPFHVVLEVYKKNAPDWEAIKQEYFLKFKVSYNELFFKMNIFDKPDLVDWWQDYKKKVDEYLNI